MKVIEKTLLKSLREGILPGYLNNIAQHEGVSIEFLIEKILSGRVVVPHNVFRTIKQPCAIGEGLKVKINANIGSSEEYPDSKVELEKLRIAVEAGADTVMDLSTGGNVDELRKEIINNSPVPVGTVPIYEAALKAIEKSGSIVEMKTKDFMKAVESQAKDGVDFMTIHSGIDLKAVEILEKHPRLIGVVSRGGSFLIAWMIHNEKENPYYEYFDEVLKILKKYDVTLSLGDGLRPGCIHDATDMAQLTELMTLGELVKKAREAEVQVMVEGPGHIPLSEIELNVRLEKSICDGTPFYVLGPLPTDSAPGYDHIVSAVGGALAAYYGADFLCYVTPREHLGLPDISDVREGVIAAKIAAHIADVARGRKDALKKDERMSIVRKNLDWKKQIESSLDPQKTRKSLLERSSLTGPCTMCGNLCAMDIISKYLKCERPESC